MECMTGDKIQEYIAGELSGVEASLVRDHLIVCGRCAEAHRRYNALEQQLLQPVEILPPPVIERNVLRELFLLPKLPTYSSILTLIAASFLLLVTWIYIYFDFAGNSMIQALQLTSSSTSNWIASVIKGISAVFSIVYGMFKVLNRFLEILLDVNLGAGVVGLLTLVLFLGLIYPLIRIASKRLKSR